MGKLAGDEELQGTFLDVHDASWPLWAGPFVTVAVRPYVRTLQVGGKWMAVWIMVAAACSQVGQYQAEMASDSYQVRQFGSTAVRWSARR